MTLALTLAALSVDAHAGPEWSFRHMVVVGRQLYGPTAPRTGEHWRLASQGYEAAVHQATAQLDLRSRELDSVEARFTVVWDPEPVRVELEDPRGVARDAYLKAKAVCLTEASVLASMQLLVLDKIEDPWTHDNLVPDPDPTIAACDGAARKLVQWHEVAKGGRLEQEDWLDPAFQTLAWRIASYGALIQEVGSREPVHEDFFIRDLSMQADQWLRSHPMEANPVDGALACRQAGRAAAMSLLGRAPRLDAFLEVAKRTAIEPECWVDLELERRVPGFERLVDLAGRERHRGAFSRSLAPDCIDPTCSEDASEPTPEHSNDGLSALL